MIYGKRDGSCVRLGLSSDLIIFLDGKYSSSLDGVNRRSSSDSCFDMIYGKWDGLMRSPRIKLWLNYFFGWKYSSSLDGVKSSFLLGFMF